tara:strand:- start:46015 stop:46866 length:852 start_codon:yes stop_codon:yes gene_type:complete
MNVFRIISKLDIKDLYLVNSRLLEGLRVLGDPKKFIKTYYDLGVDEIILHDVTASYIGRNTLYDKLKVMTEDIFLPLTLGGGIRNLNDISNILKCGADKIFFNTSIIENPKFAEEAIKIYGSSTISANVVVSKNENDYILLKNHGRDYEKKDPRDWINFLEDIGIGEIILTFAHKEGLKKGYDLEFMNLIKDNISVPFLINGGASNVDSIIELSKYSFVSGVVISTIFHEIVKHNGSNLNINNLSQARFDNLNESKYKNDLKKNNIINQIKTRLINKNILVRN